MKLICDQSDKRSPSLLYGTYAYYKSCALSPFSLLKGSRVVKLLRGLLYDHYHRDHHSSSFLMYPISENASEPVRIRNVND